MIMANFQINTLKLYEKKSKSEEKEKIECDQ